MFKYFRTLFYLICFLLEDEFLFIFHPKDDDYYPIIKVVRQILKNHLLEPFKSTHTLYINPDYSFAFQARILIRYKQTFSYKIKGKALDEWLLKFNLSSRNIIYNNGVISSFSYSYI